MESLVAHVHLVGEEPFENLINEAAAGDEEIVQDEVLHALGEEIYSGTVEQVRGAWTLRWKCQD